MSQVPLTNTFIETHIIAAIIGVVIGEILTFISFDIRLMKAIVRKRRLRPMPLAYLTARYTMTFGVSILAYFTLPIARGEKEFSRAVHWLRAVILPLLFTATSAVVGYRALILHFERPRLISRLIHTLLVAEFVGGTGVMTLAVADSEKELGSGLKYVSPVWISAPVIIAIVIDAIFTLMVVIPIVRREEKPRQGEVMHLLLTDAMFFGTFSIVAKSIAVGLTLWLSKQDRHPYLPVRVETLACTILACRIFRGQETFLRTHQDRKADPSLRPIELDECTPPASVQFEEEKGDVEKAPERLTSETRAQTEGKSSLEPVRSKATVTVTDGCLDAARDIDRSMARNAAEQTRRKRDKAVWDRLREALLAG